MRDRFRRSESIEKAAVSGVPRWGTAEGGVRGSAAPNAPRCCRRRPCWWRSGRRTRGSSSGSGNGRDPPRAALRAPRRPPAPWAHGPVRGGGVGGRPGGSWWMCADCAPPGARRPFLRYQRSLTESAFIFRRPEPPASPTPPDPGTFQAAAPPSPRRPPGTPPSPAGVGPPHAGSPVGTWRPPCATVGSPPRPPGTGTPSPISPPGPPSSPPRLLSPLSPPGSGCPDSTRRAEPLPPSSTSGLGPPSSTARGPPPLSPPRQPPAGAVEEEVLPLPSPPSTPLDEEGPPPGTPPLPSPPAWGAPELPVGLGEGVLSPQEGPPPPGLPPAPLPPRSPSPPGLKDAAVPCLAPHELQQGGCTEPPRGGAGMGFPHRVPPPCAWPGGGSAVSTPPPAGTGGEHQLEPELGTRGQNGIGGWTPPWDPPEQVWGDWWHWDGVGGD